MKFHPEGFILILWLLIATTLITVTCLRLDRRVEHVPVAYENLTFPDRITKDNPPHLPQ